MGGMNSSNGVEVPVPVRSRLQLRYERVRCGGQRTRVHRSAADRVALEEAQATVQVREGARGFQRFVSEVVRQDQTVCEQKVFDEFDAAAAAVVVVD